MRSLNNLVHRDYLDEIARLFWWGLCLCVSIVFLPCWIVFWCYEMYLRRFGDTSLCNPAGRLCFISGCDSGFGYDLAIDLATRGYKCYAGVIRPESIESLRSIGLANLVPVQVDVTKDDDCARVVKMIAADKSGEFTCLVNNAGIGGACPVDWCSLNSYYEVMEVNFFGVVRLTKAFLPLLKGSTVTGKRIVTVTSLAGLLPGSALMSAYAASKHASEAFCSSMVHEVAAFGIDIVTVNPSFHKTNIVMQADVMLKKGWSELSKEMKEEYGEEYVRTVSGICEQTANGRAWDPAFVLKGLRHAAVGNYPKRQYLIGIDAKFLLQLLNFLPLSILRLIGKLVGIQDHLTPAAVKYGRKGA